MNKTDLFIRISVSNRLTMYVATGKICGLPLPTAQARRGSCEHSGVWQHFGELRYRSREQIRCCKTVVCSCRLVIRWQLLCSLLVMLDALASPATGHWGTCNFRLIFWPLQSRTNSESLSLDSTWLLTRTKHIHACCHWLLHE